MSATLARLCITEQSSLKRLGSLRLPALRDLLLHSNGLESLEGLEGCPRIQRLWVWGNRLRSLSGLHAQADLRELWAQDNRLERVGGVEHLVSLQVLDVAGNPVANLRDVQKLAHLPRLRSVSFSDPHFGSCPVVRAAGYRQFVLASLPALTHLDGQTVGPQDRDGADEAFLRQAEEFEAAREQREGAFDEVLDRLAARAGSAADAEAAAGEELAALVRGLEGTVRRGRAAVEAEGARVVRVQAEARRELERSAGAIECMRDDWVRRAEAAGEQAIAWEREALGWCEVEDACLRAFERAFFFSVEEEEEGGVKGARGEQDRAGAAPARKKGRGRKVGSEGVCGSSSPAGAGAAAARDRKRDEGQDEEGSYSEDEGWAEDGEDEEQRGRGRGGGGVPVPGGGGRFGLPSLPLLVAQLPPHAPDAKSVRAEAQTACAGGAGDVLRCGRCHSPVAEAAFEAVAAAQEEERASSGRADEAARPVVVPAAAFGGGPGGGAGRAAPRLWGRGSAGLERLPREGWLVGAPAAVASVLRIGAGGVGRLGRRAAGGSGGAAGALQGEEAAGKDRGAGESGGAVFAPTLKVALEAAREAGAGLRCASEPLPASAAATTASGLPSALAVCACRCEVLGLLAAGGAEAESPAAS